MEDQKDLHQKYKEFGKHPELMSLLLAMLVYGVNNMTQERDYYRTLCEIKENPNSPFKENPKEFARVFVPTFDKFPVTEEVFLVMQKILHTDGFMGEDKEDIVDIFGLDQKSFDHWMKKWEDEETELNTKK